MELNGDAMLEKHRTLTDDDIEAILDAFESRWYRNIGKGVWSIVWKAVLGALLAVGAYGAYHKG
jgi:hypothetical protein